MWYVDIGVDVAVRDGVGDAAVGDAVCMCCWHCRVLAVLSTVMLLSSMMARVAGVVDDDRDGAGGCVIGVGCVAGDGVVLAVLVLMLVGLL